MFKTLCRVLLKKLRKWAQPPYDQKVLKTDSFRHDFVMVLNGYQYQEIAGDREEPFKTHWSGGIG